MSAFIDEHRGVFGVEPICEALQIAPSTYYAVCERRRRPAARTLRDRELLGEIRRVYDASGGLYGARKVWWQLQAEGVPRGALHGRAPHAPGRPGGRGPRQARAAPRSPTNAPTARWTWSTATSPRPPRTAFGSRISRMWRRGRAWSMSRLSSTRTRRRIVGWKADTNMRTGLVLDTLEMALWSRDRAGLPVAAGLIHHHDAGSQYTILCLHPASDRRRRRRVGRIRRRRLRQRTRRVDDRPLQGREDPPRRAVEDALRRRAGDAGMGRLVQHHAGCILPAADSRQRSTSTGI